MAIGGGTSTEHGEQRLSVYAARLPQTAGVFVLVAAAAVLTGWALDSAGLETLFFGSVTIKPNTASALAMGASGLLLFHRAREGDRIRRGGAMAATAICVLIGLFTLLEYVTGKSFGIDELVFQVPRDANLTATPGRMAAVTASALVFVGTGIVFVSRRTSRSRRLARPLLAAAIALPLTAILGYAYGTIPTSGLGQGIQIAVPTAVCLIVLTVGALALDLEHGWMSVLVSSEPGGVLARRLLPFAFLVPLLLGALRAFGQWSGEFSVATQAAIVAVLTMLAFGVVIWRTAAVVNAADRKRQEAERARVELSFLGVELAHQEEAARTRADAERSSRGIAEAARERAERAVAEKAEALALLEVILATAPVGFALFDRDHRFLRVNRKLAELSGAEPAAHLGLTARELVPAIGDRVHDVIQRVVETSEPVLGVDLVLPASDDAASDRGYRHLVGSFYPVHDRNEKPFAVGAIVSDTTEQRLLEEQLAQSQKMEAVGQLAGGIAHDFNNLLTVITVYSSLLLEDLASNSAQRADVQEIRVAAERATVLTGQLLAFSRKEAVQPSKIGINSLVRNVERMLQRLIGDDIEITTNLHSDLPLVLADAGQLEQVLINLAVNARDAMPNGGRLSISTELVHLGRISPGGRVRKAPGEYAMLAVADTGHGMTREVQERLFEPFFTTKEPGKGTGLGLATVYGIVKRAGGEVCVYSELAHGTVFKVYFPVAGETAEAVDAGDAAVEVRGGTETILVADDDPGIRALTERILNGFGYSVLLARNGIEALEIVQRHNGLISLVLTDVVMPEMSGRPLVERLMQSHPEVKILFMSGYPNDEVVRRGILDGLMAFIQKPFAPDDLALKVREVLDGPGAASASDEVSKVLSG